MLTTLRLLLLLLLLSLVVHAVRIDTVAIPSAVMQKTFRAVVALPASYTKNKKASYPALYLLHGAYGHFADWTRNPPDKTLVHRLADQYNLIIVMPEGETFSFYLDSPVSKASQFETHIIREVISKIDGTYRTVRRREGRVITGLSMGGHGALYLSARHPELFAAAGSMSGALDLPVTRLKLSPDETKSRLLLFEAVLGPQGPSPNLYDANSVVGMANQLRNNNLSLIIDCGVDDFLIGINREVHRRLLYNGTPHDYTERPGAHTWQYWQDALPYHLLFFQKVLEAGGGATVK